ncbi:unnamed protein product [Prunus armeniaca]
MAPRKMLKRKETEEEKIIQAAPFLIGDGVLLEREPMRHGSAWQDWVLDMKPQFGSYWKANGIYDAILFSLQDLKPESSLLASTLMF